jgi:hypothetical protein
LSSAATAAEAPKQRFLRAHLEFIIALLLGLVSIVTAYASFQATVYNGETQKYYTDGTNLRTKAESFFVEDNQTFVQDAQLYDRLTELWIDAGNPDPAISGPAAQKYDALYAQSVSDSFDAAIRWAEDENLKNPDSVVNPTESTTYVDDLFADYKSLKADSHAAIDAGDAASRLSDRLTLNTVLLALSLFLLGIAALVKIFRVKITLVSVAVVIFIVAATATAFIPFVGV